MSRSQKPSCLLGPPAQHTLLLCNSYLTALFPPSPQPGSSFIVHALAPRCSSPNCSQSHSSHSGFLPIPQPQKQRFATPGTGFILVWPVIPPHDPSSLHILQFTPSFLVCLLLWPGGFMAAHSKAAQKQRSRTVQLISPCLDPTTDK